MTDTAALIQGGLVLACSFAWADVVKTGANYIYPNNDEKKLKAQIIYSIILTLIVIMIFYFIQTTKNQIKLLLQKILETEQKLEMKLRNKT